MMHSKQQELANKLFSVNPEFKISEYNTFEDFSLIMGMFGLYLKDLIMGSEEENNDTEKLSKSFDFINYLSTKNDDYIDEILKYSILEILTDYDKTIAVSRRYLKDRALEFFNTLVFKKNS